MPGIQTSTEQTDGDLLDAVAQGDSTALERLYKRYFKRVAGFALRIVDRMDVAEEVASDTFMAVWKGAAKFEKRSKPSTWMMGIAYRLALKARDRHRLNDHLVELDDSIEFDNAGESRVEALVLQGQIAKAMRQLPAKQRAVVELTYRYGYHYREIAEIIDVPVGTVKTRMMHAHARLRALVAEPEPDNRSTSTKNKTIINENQDSARWTT